MDDYLLKLGLSDIQVRMTGKEDNISKEQLDELLKMILDVEIFIASIERKGVPFREFLPIER